MSHKKYTCIRILDKIIKMTLILIVLFWVYRIYLSFISYDESYNLPLYLEVIFQTRFYILAFLAVLISCYFVKSIRKKLHLLPIKINLLEFIKKHPYQTMIVSMLCLFLVLISLIIVLQPIILYHPNHSSYAYDQVLDLEIYEEIEISYDGLTYKGFGAIDKTKVLPTIIYFAGNGESSAQNFYQYHQSGFFTYFEDFQFIMIDYPNYGLSEGKTSDQSILKMGQAVYDHVRNLSYVDQNNIYIYGYSIGTGVATYIASTSEVKGLILIAPYSSITDLFNTRLPIFKGFLNNLVVEEFNSEEYALDVDVSPLIIASYQDQTIPIELSIKLSESFLNVYELYLIEETKHDEFMSREDVVSKMLEYLND